MGCFSLTTLRGTSPADSWISDNTFLSFKALPQPQLMLCEDCPRKVMQPSVIHHIYKGKKNIIVSIWAGKSSHKIQ
jgi:hypothetical protein